VETCAATSIARPLAQQSEFELVAEVRRGDDPAFEELYRRYSRRIAAYVVGMVGDVARAEDITQEVFVSALRRMRQTDRPIAFKPWVYEIAKNACIDSYRRVGRSEEVPLDAGDGSKGEDRVLADSGPTPDAAFDAKQRLSDLCGAFGGLSDAHHRILVMRELEGLSYREIGERMEMTRPAVESTLFRARRRLNEEYDELVTGRRCRGVQATIASAAEHLLGERDRSRMARHVAHCQPCRRSAFAAGLDITVPPPRRERVARRVASFFPLPGLWGWGRGGGQPPPARPLMAQWTANGTAWMEQLAAGWPKAAATAATLAVAASGAGAGGLSPPAPSLGVSGPVAHGTGTEVTAEAPRVPDEAAPARVKTATRGRVPTRGAATATAGGTGSDPPAQERSTGPDVESGGHAAEGKSSSGGRGSVDEDGGEVEAVSGAAGQSPASLPLPDVPVPAEVPELPVEVAGAEVPKLPQVSAATTKPRPPAEPRPEPAPESAPQDSGSMTTDGD